MLQGDVGRPAGASPKPGRRTIASDRCLEFSGRWRTASATTDPARRWRSHPRTTPAGTCPAYCAISTGRWAASTAAIAHRSAGLPTVLWWSSSTADRSPTRSTAHAAADDASKQHSAADDADRPHRSPATGAANSRFFISDHGTTTAATASDASSDGTDAGRPAASTWSQCAADACPT